jgi:uncharacterized protein (DUF433 family)
MPMRGRKRPGEETAGEAGKAGDSPGARRPRRVDAEAKARKPTPKAKAPKAAKASAAAAKPASTAKKPGKTDGSKPRSSGPRLVSKHGVMYVSGCPAPVWRLEMARRAGSGAAALADSFPGLTPEGIDLALAYARRHRAEVDRLIARNGPAEVPPTDEADDGEGFEQELDAMLDRDAALYRRLAR